MHKRAILTTLLTFTALSAAFAQEAPYSQTLDEQLTRVRAGKPAVPMATSGAALSPSAGSASESSGRSHKASPLEPTPVASSVPAPTPIAYDKNGQPIQSIGSGAIPALPLTEMISGQIVFITGGVGDEEVDQLSSVESAYSFHLLITARSGEYLSSCTLLLRDAKGTPILATGNAGPYFYAKLKPGKYSLDVTTVQGKTQTVPVQVPTNGILKKTVQFDV